MMVNVAPPTEDAEGIVGKLEGVALNSLAKVNAVVFGIYGAKIAVSSKPGNGSLDVVEMDETKLITSEDILVRTAMTTIPPSPTSKPPRGTQRGRGALAAFGTIPILAVHRLTVGGVVAGPTADEDE
jgi:hypothetical protein